MKLAGRMWSLSRIWKNAASHRPLIKSSALHREQEGAIWNEAMVKCNQFIPRCCSTNHINRNVKYNEWPGHTNILFTIHRFPFLRLAPLMLFCSAQLTRLIFRGRQQYWEIEVVVVFSLLRPVINTPYLGLQSSPSLPEVMVREFRIHCLFPSDSKNLPTGIFGKPGNFGKLTGIVESIPLPNLFGMKYT